MVCSTCGNHIEQTTYGWLLLWMWIPFGIIISALIIYYSNRDYRDQHYSYCNFESKNKQQNNENKDYQSNYNKTVYNFVKEEEKMKPPYKQQNIFNNNDFKDFKDFSNENQKQQQYMASKHREKIEYNND